MTQRRNVVDQVKDEARSQVKGAADLLQEGVSSQAYLYPIKGIFYLASHPALYKAVTPILVKLLAMSAGILAGVFFFLYLPQVAALALFSGPLAFIGAIPLCLGEAYILVQFVSRTFLVSGAQEKIFDATMLQLGHDQLVGKGRQFTTSNGGVKKLGKSISGPLSKFNTAGLVRYIVSLPLNALPVVGTVLFLLYNGVKTGPTFHSRYFQFKQMNKAQQDDFIAKNRGGYTSFGVVSLLLQLVPVVGLVFMFTTTCGAALWASDLEQGKKPIDSAAAKAQEKVRVEL